MSNEFIREKTHATGSLTPAERDRVADLRRLWTGHAARTEPINPNKIVPAIEGIYASAGLKRPHIAIAASPLAMAFAYGAAAAVSQAQMQGLKPIVGEQPDAVIAALERMTTVIAYGEASGDLRDTAEFTDEMWAARIKRAFECTETETHIAVGSEPYKTHRGEIDYRPSSLYREVRDAAGEGFRFSWWWRVSSPTAAARTAASRRTSVRRARELRRDLEGTGYVPPVDRDRGSIHTDNTAPVTQAHLPAKNSRFVRHPSVLEIEAIVAEACHAIAGQRGLKRAKRWINVRQGGDSEYSGLTCLMAFRDILGLELASHRDFAHWVQAGLEGDMRVMHEEFCIVCDFPEILKLDDRGRPHCSDGPSHRWRDGWALYHWHGTRVPQAWIEEKESLTAASALRIHNTELRRAALEIVGWHNVLRELDGKVIAENLDRLHGRLVDVKLPGDRYPSRFLHVQCATGREFALGISRRIRTVKGAHAWLTGLPIRKFKFPTIRT